MGVRKDEKKNGKWIAEFYKDGKRIRRWFDTKAEVTRFFNTASHSLKLSPVLEKRNHNTRR
ncbi:MAG: hypothetical protein KH943_09355, partial [Haemophilus parahaemolyticus]|nr:hypothetical protein [Haemophilus parahaemolyticus]